MILTDTAMVRLLLIIDSFLYLRHDLSIHLVDFSKIQFIYQVLGVLTKLVLHLLERPGPFRATHQRVQHAGALRVDPPKKLYSPKYILH